ncbi:hypothetical protein FS594_00350 [Rahnella aquatilis]|nr:type VI secretion system tube protein Hcp [Rahnella perminowiae]UJD91564.1 hypothetical protein FS594_00350 [Rahnella aquatilis]
MRIFHVRSSIFISNRSRWFAHCWWFVEAEYFNIILENVKVTSIAPNLYPGNQTGTHFETIPLRYESITWKYVNGNIIYKDTWNERITA